MKIKRGTAKSALILPFCVPDLVLTGLYFFPKSKEWKRNQRKSQIQVFG